MYTCIKAYYFIGDENRVGRLTEKHSYMRTTLRFPLCEIWEDSSLGKRSDISIKESNNCMTILIWIVAALSVYNYTALYVYMYECIEVYK